MNTKEYNNRVLIPDPSTQLQRKYNAILRAFKDKPIIAEFNDTYGTTVDVIYHYDYDLDLEYIDIFDTYEKEIYKIYNYKSLTFWTSPNTKKKEILNIYLNIFNQ